MNEAFDKHTAFRELHAPIPPIRRENSLFWWLAGIALAVCFLAITLHSYVLSKMQPAPIVYKERLLYPGR